MVFLLPQNVAKSPSSDGGGLILNFCSPGCKKINFWSYIFSIFRNSVIATQKWTKPLILLNIPVEWIPWLLILPHIQYCAFLYQFLSVQLLVSFQMFTVTNNVKQKFKYWNHYTWLLFHIHFIGDLTILNSQCTNWDNNQK
jgi:hypothetical protein